MYDYFLRNEGIGVWHELITACLLIIVAEMGDKSQILAMAFASKYPVSQVLIGISLGALLNHGIAVFLGSSLGKIIPVDAIKVIAGLAFIIFALWTLAYDEAEFKQTETKKHSPIITVLTAFFISELGDKTQLTAIALASGSDHPFMILIGTVSGMIISSACGILVSRRMERHLPDSVRKILSAGVFLFFGLTHLYQNIPPVYLTPNNIFVAIMIIGLSLIYVVRKKEY